jgi:hypothetical protein
VNNQFYTRAGYGFNSRKRSANIASEIEDCVKPDLLTMIDSQTYALSGIDDATMKIIVKHLMYSSR